MTLLLFMIALTIMMLLAGFPLFVSFGIGGLAMIVALPLILVIALCVWSFLRWLREDAARDARPGD